MKEVFDPSHRMSRGTLQLFLQVVIASKFVWLGLEKADPTVVDVAAQTMGAGN